MGGGIEDFRLNVGLIFRTLDLRSVIENLLRPTSGVFRSPFLVLSSPTGMYKFRSVGDRRWEWGKTTGGCGAGASLHRRAAEGAVIKATSGAARPRRTVTGARRALPQLKLLCLRLVSEARSLRQLWGAERHTPASAGQRLGSPPKELQQVGLSSHLSTWSLYRNGAPGGPLNPAPPPRPPWPLSHGPISQAPGLLAPPPTPGDFSSPCRCCRACRRMFWSSLPGLARCPAPGLLLAVGRLQPRGRAGRQRCL